MDVTTAPMDIVLYGFGAYVEALVPLLKANGVTVHCVVNEKGIGYSETSGYTVDFYRDAVHKPSHAVVFVGSVGPSSVNSEEYLTQYSQALSRLPDVVRLYHPVALADMLECRFKHRVFLSGFPGSGNGTFGAILRELEKIYGYHHYAAGAELEALRMSGYYYGVMKALLERIGSSLGYPGISIGPLQREMCALSLVAETGARIAFYGGRMPSYLFTQYYQTHEFHSKYINDLAGKGYELGIILRHPLDVIVSVAKKLWTTCDVIDDIDVFVKFACAIRGHWESYVNAMPDVPLFRYEDIYTDYGGIVARLNELLGYPSLEQEVIAKIKDRTFLRPVAKEGHLWRAGNRKFLEYLDRRHLAVLQQLRYGDFLEAFGYDLPELGERREKLGFYDKNLYPGGDIGNYIEMYNIGDEKNGLYFRTSDGELIFNSNPAVRDAVSPHFEDRMFRGIVNSSRFDQFQAGNS